MDNDDKLSKLTIGPERIDPRTWVERIFKEVGMQGVTKLDMSKLTPNYEPMENETESERAKRLMLEAAEQVDMHGTPEGLGAELRDCAENILAEDQFEAIVTVLTRLSGKPARFVKRVLNSKLGVTG